jgi:endoglucanase
MAAGGLDRDARFFAPGAQPGALQQIDQLRAAGRDADAGLIAAMAAVPQAVWITQGTPEEARQRVAEVTAAADEQQAVPVLVAYDVPGRDCGGYSAGGARTTEEYLRWIDGFASGIGDRRAVVVLEPDGLGLLPSDCGGPGPDYPFTDEERYAQLEGAVGRLVRQPHVSVYLDGTHGSWLSVGDAAGRLAAAGVERARGFFLNVSNYCATEACVAYGTAVSERIAASLGHAVPQAHFVIDTSRNGRGPWRGELEWCNPPGRGLGLRPTADTNVPLLDAYLWVKVPGESDGRCRGPIDPEWGIADPPAGQWFPEQALELAQRAQPPLGS